MTGAAGAVGATDPAPIGCYVHHAGAGHGALGSALSAVLGERLVGLGSGGRPHGWQGRWIGLPRDDDPPPVGDPTRAGAWHWVPAGHDGFARRMRRITRWIDDERPAALVSDVSCEVVALGALLGVPTAAVVLPGRREDPPHRTAFATADVLLAPWPADPAAGLVPLGLISRFDDRPPPPPPTGRDVLVLLPSGGHTITATQVEQAAAATAPAGWRWTVAGPTPEPAIGSDGKPSDPVTGTGGVRWVGRVDDPWELLGGATVVVAASGLGSVADAAAARRPAGLLPQDRPFAEQHALAERLEGRAPVVVRASWPEAEAWPALLADAANRDPGGWDAVHDRAGAARYAAAVRTLAGG